MKMLLVAALLLFQAIPEKSKEEKPKEKAPEISAVQKTQFFKAQSQINSTQLLLERTIEFKNHEKAQHDFQQLVQEFAVLCGTKYQPALDSSGDPYCQEKEQPKPAALEAPKK